MNKQEVPSSKKKEDAPRGKTENSEKTFFAVVVACEAKAERHKDPATELAAPKFQGTEFWPAKIMLVGDLVK